MAGVDYEDRAILKIRKLGEVDHESTRTPLSSEFKHFVPHAPFLEDPGVLIPMRGLVYLLEYEMPAKFGN